MRRMTKHAAPEVKEIAADELFKALANPVRREILAWLKAPQKNFAQQRLPFDNGVCAGCIHERSGLSQSTVSAHLACLQRAGLVTTTKVGQWIFYQRNEELIASFYKQLRVAL
jgi:ArsR family transcriptional regulator